MIEEPLFGGSMSVVVRVGDTVRRVPGFWTPQVHRLLVHLRSQGIHEVPTPLGFDEQGREILTFLPGQVGNDPLPTLLRADKVLVSAARLLRRIHDATQEVAASWPSGWQAKTRQPLEVICHGDFAPYNCVFDGDNLTGLIDFDHAHPGSRIWDIAYALYRFAPLAAPSNPDGYGTLTEQARRLRLFCDSYGLTDRSNVLPTTLARLAAMADFLRDGAAQGDPRMQANIAAGHLAIYLNDYAYLETHQDIFHHALTCD